MKTKEALKIWLKSTLVDVGVLSRADVLLSDNEYISSEDIPPEQSLKPSQTKAVKKKKNRKNVVDILPASDLVSSAKKSASNKDDHKL